MIRIMSDDSSIDQQVQTKDLIGTMILIVDVINDMLYNINSYTPVIGLLLLLVF